MEAHDGIAAEEDRDHADGHQESDEDVPEDGDDHPDEVQAFYSGTTQQMVLLIIKRISIRYALLGHCPVCTEVGDTAR